MKVLVTGASGRVGSRLVTRLLERGYDVRVLVRSKEQVVKFQRYGAEAVIGDLLEPSTLGQATASIDAVIHLAAFFRGATEAEARAVNLDGTLALADAARRCGTSRFVFISTNLVYGSRYGRPAREDDIPRPPKDRYYPVSKLAAESALAELYRDWKTSLCILRLAFVYGEGDPHLQEAVKLTRAWPSAKRMQMVHHADVAQGIMLSLDKPQAGGQIYNVADNTPIPISEIRLRNGLIGQGQNVHSDVRDPWEGIVDTTKIKNELGFQPIYPSMYIAEKKEKF